MPRALPRWLEERGRRLFGQELEHGDEAGAPGFEAGAGGPKPEPSPAEAGQGPEKAVADEPQGAVAEEPATERDAGPATDDRELVTGRLRAVSDGSPGEPPATALDRHKIAHWRQAGRYREETVEAIAELACGEKVLERLSREHVRRVAWLLELAVAGRVSQRTLAGAVTRAHRGDQRDEGARELEAWLREKTDEVGLLGRREAA